MGVGSVEYQYVYEGIDGDDPTLSRYIGDAYDLADRVGIYIDNHKEVAEVAIDNSKVVGAIFKGEYVNQHPPEVYIDVVVDPQYQQCGIGKSLVRDMMTETDNLAGELGVIVWLKANCVSGAGIRLMQSVGMERVAPYASGTFMYGYESYPD